MIQLNELRIGNWFKTNIYQQVTLEHLDFLLNDNIKDKSVMQPIELTAEILEKCGFMKEKGIDVYSLGRLRLWIGTRGKSLCYLIEEDTTTGHYITSIEYIHQLQNLVFALTGEELDVKL